MSHISDTILWSTLFFFLVLTTTAAQPTTEKPQTLRLNRFIDDWLLLGPFDHPQWSRNDLLRIPFLMNESRLAPAEGDSVPYLTHNFKWQRYSGGTVDLGDYYSKTGIINYACAYAVSEFEVSKEGKYRLVPYFVDGIKIWVNGSLTLEMRSMADLHIGERFPLVELRKGTNTIVIKSANMTGYWGFSILFEPAYGRRMSFLEENANRAFQMQSMPPARVLIHDKKTSKVIQTWAEGFGATYRTAFVPPDVEFDWGEIEISINQAPGVAKSKHIFHPADRQIGLNDFSFASKYTGKLSGYIQDEITDEPIADATIKLGWKSLISTKTDTSGAYHFENVLPGSILARVLAPGYIPWAGFINTSESNNDKSNVTFLVRGSHDFIGEIINAWTGEPIPGVDILCNLGGLNEFSTITDTQGRFYLDFNDQQRARYWINTFLDGFQFQNFPPPTRRNILLAIKRLEIEPIELAVQCRLADGSHWANANIHLFHIDQPTSAVMKQAETSLQGMAKLSNLPRGAYYIIAHDSTHGATARKIQIYKQEESVELTAPSSSPKTYKIIGPDGAKVEGAEIIVAALHPECPVQYLRTSDSNGLFEIPSMEIDESFITIRKTGFAPLNQKLIPRQPIDEFRIEVPDRIIVEIRQANTNTIIREADLYLIEQNEEGEIKPEIDVIRCDDGRFILEFKSVPKIIDTVALFTARGYELGYKQLNEIIHLAQQDNRKTTMNLTPVRTHSMTVTSPAGAIISGVEWGIFAPDIPYRQEHTNFLPEPLASENGSNSLVEFSLPPTDNAKWKLLLEKPSYGYALIDLSKTPSKSKRLEKFANVSGQIQLSGSTQQIFAIIARTEGQLKTSGLHIEKIARVSSLGYFELRDLIPGQWRLECVGWENYNSPINMRYPLISFPVTVKSGESLFLELPNSNSARLKGSIEAPSGSPRSCTIIMESSEVDPEQRTIINYHTRDDGDFFISSIRPGKWTVTIHPRHTNWGRAFYTDRNSMLTETLTFTKNQTLQRSFKRPD